MTVRAQRKVRLQSLIKFLCTIRIKLVLIQNGFYVKIVIVIPRKTIKKTSEQVHSK